MENEIWKDIAGKCYRGYEWDFYVKNTLKYGYRITKNKWDF